MAGYAMSKEKKSVLPRVRGKKWIRARLPQGRQPWTIGRPADAADELQQQALQDTLQCAGLHGKWQWPRRQVFFVALGGFDTHSTQATDLPVLQQDISDSIAAFYTATEELGIANEVTTFTAADFGRTLTVNGDGTDHGWGGHHFVVGGAVNGGDIYGDIPEPVLGHGQDSGNGRLIPTISVEQFAAPMGAWYGLSQAELKQALPGLASFPGDGLGLF